MPESRKALGTVALILSEAAVEMEVPPSEWGEPAPNEKTFRNWFNLKKA